MKKKKLANLIMVAVILAIAAAGILVVGSIQGWFGGNEDAALLTDIRGIVTMERDGIAYNLQEDTSLREGDKLTFAADASAVIQINEVNRIAVGEKAEVTIIDASIDQFGSQLVQGEVFVTTESTASINDISFTGSCGSLQVDTEETVLHVYAGTVLDTAAGQSLRWRGAQTLAEEISVDDLTDFQLRQLKKAGEQQLLCFTLEDLISLEESKKAQTQTQPVQTEAEGPSPEEMTLSCTIEILCDTILDNWDKMDTTKTAYVPEDGVILRVEVPFAPGEAVIDVLKRACETNNVQIEYSWTPLYDSYYVEGINNIYEFDCGAESGWMYKVNDWFPNYGCSDYILEGGEVITWCYSCVGLGADVGGSNWE